MSALSSYSAEALPLAPSNGPQPMTPQQRHNAICSTFDQVTKGTAVAADVAGVVSVGAGAVVAYSTVATLIPGAAIVSAPVAAGATLTAVVSGGVFVGLKGFQYLNTYIGRNVAGCTENAY